jgi:hypothetical protein
MRGACILDSERMQVELGLDLFEKGKIGFEQADPHHMTRPFGPFAGLADRNIGNPPPTGIDARCHDAPDGGAGNEIFASLCIHWPLLNLLSAAQRQT